NPWLSSKYNTKIGPDPHRAEPDIHIAETDPEKTAPGPQHVITVEAAHAVVGFLLRRRVGQLIAIAADQVAERVAAERIAAEQDHVEQQHDGADADAEVPVAVRILEAQGLDEVPREQHDEDQGDVEGIAMGILQDER